MTTPVNASPAPAQPAAVPALLSVGFRPFFLLAAAYAGVVLPLWLAILRGRITDTPVQSTQWHAHEMLFGYAVAVIAGFLLTAVMNWTKRPTARGRWLLALAGLWGAGRVLFSPGLGAPLGLVAAVDLAFLPALAFAIGRPLIAAESRRNLPIVGIVCLLWLMNVGVFLDAAGVAPGWGVRTMRAALMLVVLLMLVIGGRVIPMFTRNATGAQVRSLPLADRVALGGTVALLVAELLTAPGAWMAILAGFTGAAVLVRSACWGAQRTLRSPILWVLHLGHAWIGVGLLLRMATLFEVPFALSASYHALTVGAIGTLTLGMMARVALGHTGRPLRVGWPTAIAFLLMTAAAVARVLVPMIDPGAYLRSLEVSGLLWTGAMVIYLLVYTPVLLRPRADGG